MLTAEVRGDAHCLCLYRRVVRVPHKIQQHGDALAIVAQHHVKGLVGGCKCSTVRDAVLSVKGA